MATWPPFCMRIFTQKSSDNVFSNNEKELAAKTLDFVTR